MNYIENLKPAWATYNLTSSDIKAEGVSWLFSFLIHKMQMLTKTHLCAWQVRGEWDEVARVGLSKHEAIQVIRRATHYVPPCSLPKSSEMCLCAMFQVLWKKEKSGCLTVWGRGMSTQVLASNYVFFPLSMGEESLHSTYSPTVSVFHPLKGHV